MPMDVGRKTSILRKQKNVKPSGATLVLLALLMPIFVGLVAFSVDVAHMFLVRSQLQTAVDAGSLAGSIQLRLDDSDADAAVLAAKDFVRLNRVGWLVTVPENAIEVEAGAWDSVSRSFSMATTDYNAVRVDAQVTGEPLSFAGILGFESFGVPRGAIATNGDEPMDIMLVLDLSGSMAAQGRIEALREAVPVFTNVIEDIGDNDRIGVMGYGALPAQFSSGSGALYQSAPSYLYPSGSTWVGVLEASLTYDFDYLRTNTFSSSSLKANKYQGWTPVGAAIRDTAHYLDNNARTGIKRIMVLMSDGHANRPNGNGPGYAMDMAVYAEGLDIDVYTIGLGNGADHVLMENIATTANGLYFDASGSGQAELAQRLKEAFRDVVNEIKRTEVVR